jgi:hypothetical protein
VVGVGAGYIVNVFNYRLYLKESGRAHPENKKNNSGRAHPSSDHEIEREGNFVA